MSSVMQHFKERLPTPYQDTKIFRRFKINGRFLPELSVYFSHHRWPSLQKLTCAQLIRCNIFGPWLQSEALAFHLSPSSCLSLTFLIYRLLLLQFGVLFFFPFIFLPVFDISRPAVFLPAAAWLYFLSFSTSVIPGLHLLDFSVRAVSFFFQQLSKLFFLQIFQFVSPPGDVFSPYSIFFLSTSASLTLFHFSFFSPFPFPFVSLLLSFLRDSFSICE